MNYRTFLKSLYVLINQKTMNDNTQDGKVLSVEESEQIIIKAGLVDLYEKMTGRDFIDFLTELSQQDLPNK